MDGTNMYLLQIKYLICIEKLKMNAKTTAKDTVSL